MAKGKTKKAEETKPEETVVKADKQAKVKSKGNKAFVEIVMLKNYEGDEPKIAHEGDAGIDLRNCSGHEMVIRPGKQQLIPTGLQMAIPEGYCGIVFERSGLGKKYGAGIHGRIIDSGYRGEVGVILSTKTKLVIPRGERVAQIVFTNILTDTKIVKELSKTKRGADGFGSTGNK